MATTRIWSIKGRLDSVINYVKNPEKTDSAKYTDSELQALEDVIRYAENADKTHQRLYVTGINCSSDIARDQMIMTKKQFDKTDKVLAYHGYQSFPPGEVTPDLAHEVGVELAKRLWGERFQILVTTHLDKDHLHNHFCLNSVSFTDGAKFRGGIKAYNIMRDASDKLCREYGLSVIENPEYGKSKHYAEWKAEKAGLPTMRGQIREEIDEIIKCSYTYKDFWRILQQRGYEVKYGENVKHIALQPSYSQRFVRLKSLGADYTEEKIQERIRMARIGIKSLSSPSVDYNAWAKKYEPQKLNGFKALYYHYLYLFGRILKKETPQRVSFYLREELTKLERYQKQFKFLCENDIETVEQLAVFRKSAEDDILKLTAERQMLYDKPDGEKDIRDINLQLSELRKKVKLCKDIVEDSKRIQEKHKQAVQLEQQVQGKSQVVYKNYFTR